MSPFSMFGGNGGGQGGKMTVINSGPGYTEEKHYNIMPDGKLVEVMEKSDESKYHATDPTLTVDSENWIQILFNKFLNNFLWLFLSLLH